MENNSKFQLALDQDIHENMNEMNMSICICTFELGISPGILHIVHDCFVFSFIRKYIIKPHEIFSQIV